MREAGQLYDPIASKKDEQMLVFFHNSYLYRFTGRRFWRRRFLLWLTVITT